MLDFLKKMLGGGNEAQLKKLNLSDASPPSPVFDLPPSLFIAVAMAHTRAARMAENLREYEMSAFYSEDEDRVVGPREVMVVYGNLHQGFEYPNIRFVVIDESDIFGREHKKKAKKSPYSGARINALSELTNGAS